MRMRRIIILLAVMVCTASMVRAERYTLGRYTLDANGTISSGARYSISGLIGQKETGMTISSNELIGGFWTPGSVCIVNLEDFAAFLAHWLDGPCNNENDYCGGADLDGENGVSIDDLKILSGYWLDICPFGWTLESIREYYLDD